MVDEIDIDSKLFRRKSRRNCVDLTSNMQITQPGMDHHYRKYWTRNTLEYTEYIPGRIEFAFIDLILMRGKVRTAAGYATGWAWSCFPCFVSGSVPWALSSSDVFIDQSFRDILSPRDWRVGNRLTVWHRQKKTHGWTREEVYQCKPHTVKNVMSHQHFIWFWEKTTKILSIHSKSSYFD